VLGASVTQAPFLRYARKEGHHVVVVDGDPAASARALADAFEVVDFTDVESVIDVARRHAVEGVLAVGSDRAVLPAAQVADRLSLPSIGSEVARAMTDKELMRARLQAVGVRQPQYAVLEWPDIRVGRAPMPTVLKPADSGGQRGVFLVHDRAEVDLHIRETLSHSPTRRALLEQYIDGTELNGIVVVRDGVPALITLSDRLRPPGPGFGVGWVHSFPSSLESHELEGARELAFAAVSALGLRDGIAFPQMIIDGNGDAWLVEIAARIPAGQMADLVANATGINLHEIAIRLALGQRVPDELIAPRFVRPVAIRFFTAEPGMLPVGTVMSVDGLDTVRTAPGVLAADVYFGTGDAIRPVQVDADRNGYVIATGESASEALVRADAASERLEVRVD
jgi:biotin carboxylase